MNIRLPRHFCKIGLFIFLFLCFPLVQDGQHGRQLPISNDIYIPNFIPMEKLPGAADASFEVSVRIGNPEILANTQRIAMKFGTYFKTVQIQTAELIQKGGDCRFSINGPTELADGGALNFFSEPCAWLNDKDFTLRILGNEIAGIAVLGYEGLSETQNNPQIFVVDRQGSSLAVSGYFQPRQASVTEYWPRIRMLSYMWHWSNDWIYFALFLFAALALVAFSFSYLINTTALRTPQNSKQRCVAAALLIMGLHMSYACLSPPFQAADEADHFLSFSKIGGLHRAEQESLSLANLAHFDRLMCHVNEKFTKADIGRPMVQSQWNSFHVGYVDVPSRSGLANFIWPVIAQVFFGETSSPERVHLGLRLFNGLYFTTVFFITLLIYRRSDSIDIGDGLLSLLLVPTLFHFSNHNSNHAFIISHYLPFILAFRPIVTARPLTRGICIWIGLNLGLCFLSGRIGLIFLLVSYGCFVLRWIVMGLEEKATDRSRILHSVSDFTLVILAMSAMILCFWKSNYLTFQLNSLRQLIGVSDWLLLGLLFATAAGPLVFCWMGNVIRDSMYNMRIALCVKSFFWVIGVSLVVCLLFPIFKDIPPLINIEYLNPRLSGWQYTQKVLKHFVLSWGWGGQDFYLVQSFWGGFGCPEPVLGNVAVQIIKGLFATVTTLSFLQAVKRGQWRVCLILVCCFGLLLANLAFLAYGSAAQPSNLHGRYMVGFYLIAIQVFMLSWQHKKDAEPKQTYLAYGTMLVMVLVQTASVWYLSDRYF